MLHVGYLFPLFKIILALNAASSFFLIVVKWLKKFEWWWKDEEMKHLARNLKLTRMRKAGVGKKKKTSGKKYKITLHLHVVIYQHMSPWTFIVVVCVSGKYRSCCIFWTLSFPLSSYCPFPLIHLLHSLDSLHFSQTLVSAKKLSVYLHQQDRLWKLLLLGLSLRLMKNKKKFKLRVFERGCSKSLTFL